jgi:hypothetical protein
MSCWGRTSGFEPAATFIGHCDCHAQFVLAVEGTPAKIADTGRRHLVCACGKVRVLLGGASIIVTVSTMVCALKQTTRRSPVARNCDKECAGKNRSRASHCRRSIQRSEIKEAVEAGATVLVLREVNADKAEGPIDYAVNCLRQSRWKYPERSISRMFGATLKPAPTLSGRRVDAVGTS